MADAQIARPVAAVAVPRRSPLHGLALPVRVGVVAVADAGPATRLAYRGAPEHVGSAFGVDLPSAPMRAAKAGDRAALRLGPDEWLLLAPPGEVDTLGGALSGALVGKAASLVDVSHRNAGVAVSGPRAAWLLGAGCPLDLDAAAFPVGMCTRTLVGKAEIVLWRRAPDTFRLELLRSYAPYVVGYLAEVAREIR